LSVLSRGEWKYRELVAPTCALAAVSILSTIILAAIYWRRRGALSVVALAGVFTLVSGAVASGIFFGVLENCHLSCGTRIRARLQSPNGHATATWSVESCTSTTRACPPISLISVSEHFDHTSEAEQNVFSINTDDGVEMQWQSDYSLLIRYWPLARALDRKERIGNVRIQYQEIPVL
jgi:hypothetical protein